MFFNCTRYLGFPEQLGTFYATMTCENATVFVNRDRICETKSFNDIGNLPDLLS